MKFILERDINLQYYKVSADIYGYTREDFIITILAYVNENEKVNADELANDRFARYKVLANACLKKCKRLGYLEDKGGHYRLTSNGKLLLKEGKRIQSARNQKWGVCYASDDMIGFSYAIMKVDSEAHDTNVVEPNSDSQLSAFKEYLGYLGNRNLIVSFTNELKGVGVPSMKLYNVKDDVEGPFEPNVRMRLYWELGENESEIIITLDEKIAMDNKSTHDYRKNHSELFQLIDLSKPNPTPEEVKEGYRKVCLVIHPDKDGGKNVEKFKKITDLYKEYDKEMKSGKGGLKSRDKKKKKIMPFGQPIPSPNKTWEDVLKIIVEKAGYRWDSQNKTIILEHDEMMPEEREIGKKTLTITPDIPGCGRFDPVDIEVNVRQTYKELPTKDTEASRSSSRSPVRFGALSRFFGRKTAI